MRPCFPNREPDKGEISSAGEYNPIYKDATQVLYLPKNRKEKQRNGDVKIYSEKPAYFYHFNITFIT